MIAMSTRLRNALLAGLTALATAGAGPVQATAVAAGAAASTGNRAGSGTPARHYVPSAPAPGAEAPTLELVNARIDAIDVEARVITVRGKPLSLHPTRLQVVGPGGQALSGARALRPGMQVRFALEPEVRADRAAVAGSSQASASADAVPANRPIVLIYIDNQP